MAKNSYPTMIAQSAQVISSEEGQYNSRREWVPDFVAYKEGRQWFVQWRTSARRSGPYANKGSALASIPKATGAAQ